MRNPTAPWRVQTDRLARWGRSSGFALAGLLAVAGPGAVRGQEVLFTESFDTDGSGSRYTVEDGDAYEVPRIVSELFLNDQLGPVYWARNTEVSFVGVPAPSPDKRAVMAWGHDILPEDTLPRFFELLDGVVAWLTGSNPAATIVMAHTGTIGDTAMIDHLTAAGHTVIDDDLVSALDPSTFDMAIKSGSEATAPSRFVGLAAPVLTFEALSFDDELVSSVGTVAASEAGALTIESEGHPAAGGLTGAAPFVNGSQSFNLIGDDIPGGATVVASFERIVPATVDSLADVEGMAAGTIANSSATADVPSADLYSDASPDFGVFFVDTPVPGSPTDAFGTVGTGILQVDTAGTFSIGIGIDDGARLRIDLDRDGLDAGDDILVEDAAGAFRWVTAEVTFPATGAYDFEWVTFNSGGAYGAEIAVGNSPTGGATLPVDEVAWTALGNNSPNVRLAGMIELTIYLNEAGPEIETRPFLVTIESGADGGAVFGGGPFSGSSGPGFFGGSGLNKYGNLGAKAIEFPPIDVTGKSDLYFNFLAGATFLDFETSDYLDVWIDPDGPGPAASTRLIHFTAPSTALKYFDDRSSNPGEPTRLGLLLKKVSYPIPDGATQLVIRIEALTTWWNEIVTFDEIEITSGAVEPPLQPAVAIGRTPEGALELDFQGRLQRKVNGLGVPWVDLDPQPESPYLPDQSEAREIYYRAVVD